MAVYKYENIMVDSDKRKVFVGGTPAKLKNKDYEIFLLLIENPDKCISREEIFRHIWKRDKNETLKSDERLLNTHICNIRKEISKINKNAAKYIVTEKCYGYRLGKNYFES
jgi:DNA-binding response OmpR family regulator